MPSTWKFVGQPVSSPTVLLDMNNGLTWKTLGGDFFKLPSPPLKRSIAQNALTDGGIVSSAAYDLRTLAFTLELSGSTEDTRIGQLDDLKAELAKPANLLMYQATDSSHPVFFRTLRSDEYEVDTQFIPGEVWRVACEVLAEPFAIGIRHDIASSVTVTNDPASGTNRTFFDLTGVRGDSPSPAVVRVGTALSASNPLIMAQRTANNPTSLTLFAQAESGTMGTDTTVQSADSAMSGSGSNYVRTSFSTSSSLVARLTVTLPTGSDAAALRGRYRVYVRTRTSATGSQFTMRFLQNDGVNGPQTTFASLASTEFRHVDLGVIDTPGVSPAPATIGYSGLATQMATQPLAIQIQRNSGTATIDMDYVILMPADERLSVTGRSALQANSFVVVDGPNEVAYGMPSGTSLFGSTRTVDAGGGMVSLFGGAPMLVPGVTNRLYMLRGNDAKTVTSAVDVSYWPRWREVATV